MKDCAALSRNYRVIWNRARGVWMVVSELAKGLGKSNGRRKHSLSGLLLLIPLSLCSSLAMAAPTGGQVTAGSGTISQSGTTTTINQSSQNLSLSWKSFNVGSSETVNFAQPNSSALAVNRIYDTNGSQIMGHLNANGQVYLINPNGILFGSSAQVNVGGLVASTLDTTDNSTFAGSGTGSIVNEGTINAAKYVALLGKSVTNSGVITAKLGTVALGSGNQVSLTFSGSSLVKLQIDQSVLNSLVANHGLIKTNGGMVILGAGAKDSLLASVVNNTGVIEAGGIRTDGGTVRLVAAGGNTTNSGSIDVSGEHGGNIQLLSDKDVKVTGGTLDASGTMAGGAIRVGGGVQGGEGLTIAKRAYVADGAVLNADASGNGQGGSIAVYSQNNTVVAGTLQARGGLLGGDGGFIETSSHGGLNIVDAPQVDARAAGGLGGEWLIDPNNITIVSGSSSTNINAANPFQSSNDSASLGVNLITSALSGGANVTVTTETGGTNAQAGDITLATNLDFNNTGTNTLTFDAAHDIIINNQVYDSIPGVDVLNLKLTAGNNISLGGNLSLGTGTANLVAGGAISQTAGVITAATLTGSSAGSTALGGANLIGTLSNFSAAGLSLTNAQALTVAGIVNGGANASLTTTAGNLTLNGALSGTATSLTSAGAISQGGAGVVNATTLTGSSAGSTALGGANLIGTLGTFSAAGLSLTNAQALTVAGIVNGGANASLTTTAGNLTLNGALSGTATSLTSAGAISQGGAGVVNATTLTGSSAGSTALGGANLIGTLSTFSAAGLSLTNAQALTVAGIVNGGANASLTTTAGNLTINGALSGTATSLTSAGAISQGGAGVVNATTLTGSSVGNTALGGANLIGTLGAFQAANFTLVDAQALTVNGPVTTTSGSGEHRLDR